MSVKIISNQLEDTLALGATIGGVLRGSEVIELSSDLGGGKTAFVKGLARGLGAKDVVQSPTFTISRIYGCDRGLELHHFDFYRLTDPGVMSAELHESIQQPNTVVAIEWSDIVHDILPDERVHIIITNTGEDSRLYDISIPKKFDYILDAVNTYQENRDKA